MTQINIKAGELLLLSHGAYSDTVTDIYVALKDFDMLEVGNKFKDNFVPRKGYLDLDTYELVRLLQMHGYIATPAHRSVDLGDYDIEIEESKNITNRGVE